MMNVPLSVISGISPKNTSCSLTSRMDCEPVSSFVSQTTRRTITLIGAANVMPRWRHSSTSYLGLSRVYETNSSDDVSEKSLIGNTLLKTPCRPTSSRLSSGTSFCKNFAYLCFWMSIRLGMSMIFAIFANVFRALKLFWITGDAIYTPPCCCTNADGRRPLAGIPDTKFSSSEERNNELLLDVDLGSRLGELLLDRLGVGLRHAFLDRLRGAVDEVLGLLDAEVRHLTPRLDDADLVRAGVGQDDGDLRLLGHRRGAAASGRHRRARRRGDPRLDAPFFFQLRLQRRHVHHGHPGEGVDILFFRHIGHVKRSLGSLFTRTSKVESVAASTCRRPRRAAERAHTAHPAPDA